MMNELIEFGKPRGFKIYEVDGKLHVRSPDDVYSWAIIEGLVTQYGTFDKIALEINRRQCEDNGEAYGVVLMSMKAWYLNAEKC